MHEREARELGLVLLYQLLDLNVLGRDVDALARFAVQRRVDGFRGSKYHASLQAGGHSAAA